MKYQNYHACFTVSSRPTEINSRRFVLVKDRYTCVSPHNHALILV